MSSYQWIRKIIIQFWLITGRVTGLIFFDIDEQKEIYYHKKYNYIHSKAICIALIFLFPFAYFMMFKNLDIVAGLDDSFVKIAPAWKDIMDYIFMIFAYLFVNVNRFEIQQELNEFCNFNRFYYKRFSASFEKNSMQWSFCINIYVIKKFLFLFLMLYYKHMISINSRYLNGYSFLLSYHQKIAITK